MMDDLSKLLIKISMHSNIEMGKKIVMTKDSLNNSLLVMRRAVVRLSVLMVSCAALFRNQL